GQAVDQVKQRFAVQAEVGNQVLLSRSAIGKTGEELPRHLAALTVHQGDGALQSVFQRQGVKFAEQLLMQHRPGAGVGQAAPVEDRVAFTTVADQACAGQYLEVVA